jgi:hypothetical protein
MARGKCTVLEKIDAINLPKRDETDFDDTTNLLC